MPDNAIRTACIAASKHPIGSWQVDPRCSYPACETDKDDPHYPCNCPTAVRAAIEALGIGLPANAAAEIRKWSGQIGVIEGLLEQPNPYSPHLKAIVKEMEALADAIS